MGEWIEIEALKEEGCFGAYAGRPGGAAKAAIIVLQEIFGVNPGIMRKVDDWAARGYLALAPDLFWRFAPRYMADPDIPEQSADAFAIRAGLDAAKAVADVEACIRHARSMLGGRAKVGVAGFCMGGRIAYLTACRTDVDASVGYYGARIDQSLHEAHAIARPLMLHFAESDHFIPPVTRAQIHVALDGNPHVTIHDYAGVDHGFAATSGSRRNDAAAALADRRTADFFARHLS